MAAERDTENKVREAMSDLKVCLQKIRNMDKLGAQLLAAESKREEEDWRDELADPQKVMKAATDAAGKVKHRQVRAAMLRA